MLIATWWDHRLRVASGGARDLDDVLRRMQAGAQRRPDVTAVKLLPEAMRRVAGVEIGVDLTELVAEGRPPPLPGDVYEPCGAIVAEQRAQWERGFDFVLCSGALSVKLPDHEGHVARMLAAMFAASRRAVAVNFLSDRVDYRLEKDFHFEPEKALAMGLALSRFAAVRHDYPLFEFTLVVRREARGADRPGGHRALRGEGVRA